MGQKCGIYWRGGQCRLYEMNDRGDGYVVETWNILER